MTRGPVAELVQVPCIERNGIGRRRMRRGNDRNGARLLGGLEATRRHSTRPALRPHAPAERSPRWRRTVGISLAAKML
jgi:hypothetical protein